MSTKRLYVGNLPYETAAIHLTDLFARFGDVQDSHVVTDKDTGRSRGFGFVEMDADGAVKAIDELNDTNFGGRKLVVNEAKEREQRSTGRGPRPESGGNRRGREYR